MIAAGSSGWKRNISWMPLLIRTGSSPSMILVCSEHGGRWQCGQRWQGYVGGWSFEGSQPAKASPPRRCTRYCLLPGLLGSTGPSGDLSAKAGSKWCWLGRMLSLVNIVISKMLQKSRCKCSFDWLQFQIQNMITVGSSDVQFFYENLFFSSSITLTNSKAYFFAFLQPKFQNLKADLC